MSGNLFKDLSSSISDLARIVVLGTANSDRIQVANFLVGSNTAFTEESTELQTCVKNFMGDENNDLVEVIYLPLIVDTDQDNDMDSL